MDAKHDDLPYFENPPVIETVLGVFFRPIHQFNSVWQGVFWNEHLRTKLPAIELRQPIEEIVERFDKPFGTLEPTLRWQVSAEPELPRLWAKSVSGDRILQVQRNAILSNWLRSKDTTEYRRFADRLTELKEYYEQFVNFLRQNKLDERAPTPTSCTVTYINHIPTESWSSALKSTLAAWTGEFSDEWLPEVEQGKLQFSFAFPKARGRLHVNAASVVQRETRQPILQVELTARVALDKESEGKDDVFQAVEIAHEWIVRGFASLTRPEMHKIWSRKR